MGADFLPHRSRYWLNAKAKREAPADFAVQVEAVCTACAHAPMLEALGCHVVSTGATTGILALERAVAEVCPPARFTA
jgi:hypothetical protein